MTVSKRHKALAEVMLSYFENPRWICGCGKEHPIQGPAYPICECGQRCRFINVDNAPYVDAKAHGQR